MRVIRLQFKDEDARVRIARRAGEIVESDIDRPPLAELPLRAVLFAPFQKVLQKQIPLAQVLPALKGNEAVNETEVLVARSRDPLDALLLGNFAVHGVEKALCALVQTAHGDVLRIVVNHFDTLGGNLFDHLLVPAVIEGAVVEVAVIDVGIFPYRLLAALVKPIVAAGFALVEMGDEKIGGEAEAGKAEGAPGIVDEGRVEQGGAHQLFVFDGVLF